MTNTRKASYGVDVWPNNADEICSAVVTGCKMLGCGIPCGGNKLAKRIVAIKNCYIDCSGTENAPLAVVKTDAQIIGNTIITDNKQNGVTIVASPSAVIKRNVINGASAGVLISKVADNVVVSSNTIDDCTSGVYIMHSKEAAVLNTNITT